MYDFSVKRKKSTNNTHQKGRILRADKLH